MKGHVWDCWNIYQTQERVIRFICSQDTLLFLSGMVLVRTETGQLVMVPQQVLAQAQAKLQQGQTVANITQRPATPTATTTIRVSTATTVGLQSRQHSEPERLEPLDFPESCKCAEKMRLIGQMIIKTIDAFLPSFLFVPLES